jgi:hypothetical protein
VVAGSETTKGNTGTVISSPSERGLTKVACAVMWIVSFADVRLKACSCPRRDKSGSGTSRPGVGMPEIVGTARTSA